jgi:hypothetical protein
MKMTLPARVNRAGRSALIFGLVLGLSGCATTRDCDPRHDPGLFGSINCHGSGAYGQRIEEKRHDMTAALADKDQLLKELSEVKEDSKTKDAEIRAGENVATAMERQADDMQSQVTQQKRINAAKSRQLHAIEKEIKALRAALQKGNLPGQQVAQLKQKLREKEKEKEILLR